MQVEKLRDEMYKQRISVGSLCKATGIDRSRLYRRLQGEGNKMTIGEAKSIAKALSLSNEKAIEIFLT